MLAQPGALNESFKIVSVGLVGERKGTDVLLGALVDMPRHLDWHLTILGNGEIERFSELACKLGLESNVTFTGWCESGAVHRSSCQPIYLYW